MLSTSSSLLVILSLFATAFAGNVLYLRWAHPLLDKARWRERLMRGTMGTVLLLFAVPKLFDLGGFAAIFAKYDLVSGVFRPYAYAYPFIEIALALALMWFGRARALLAVYGAVIVLMALSLAGVARYLVSGQSLRCGCMGALLHLPLSYVTAAEGVAMLGMAAHLARAQVVKMNRRVHFATPHAT